MTDFSGAAAANQLYLGVHTLTVSSWTTLGWKCDHGHFLKKITKLASLVHRIRIENDVQFNFGFNDAKYFEQMDAMIDEVGKQQENVSVHMSVATYPPLGENAPDTLIQSHASKLRRYLEDSHVKSMQFYYKNEITQHVPLLQEVLGGMTIQRSKVTWKAGFFQVRHENLQNMDRLEKMSVMWNNVMAALPLHIFNLHLYMSRLGPTCSTLKVNSFTLKVLFDHEWFRSKIPQEIIIDDRRLTQVVGEHALPWDMFCQLLQLPQVRRVKLKQVDLGVDDLITLGGGMSNTTLCFDCCTLYSETKRRIASIDDMDDESCEGALGYLAKLSEFMQ